MARKKADEPDTSELANESEIVEIASVDSEQPHEPDAPEAEQPQYSDELPEGGSLGIETTEYPTDSSSSEYSEFREENANGNRYPVVIANGQECAVDLREMIVWTSLCWRILEPDEIINLSAANTVFTSKTAQTGYRWATSILTLRCLPISFLDLRSWAARYR